MDDPNLCVDGPNYDGIDFLEIQRGVSSLTIEEWEEGYGVGQIPCVIKTNTHITPEPHTIMLSIACVLCFALKRNKK